MTADQNIEDSAKTEPSSETKNAKTIKSQLLSKLQTSGKEVVETYIENAYKRGIEERVSILGPAQAAFEKLEEAVKRFKPDLKRFNEDGSEAEGDWSVSQKNKRNETIGKLNALSSKIEKALASGSESAYNDLKTETGNAIKFVESLNKSDKSDKPSEADK